MYHGCLPILLNPLFLQISQLSSSFGCRLSHARTSRTLVIVIPFTEPATHLPVPVNRSRQVSCCHRSRVFKSFPVHFGFLLSLLPEYGDKNKPFLDTIFRSIPSHRLSGAAGWLYPHAWTTA